MLKGEESIRFTCELNNKVTISCQIIILDSPILNGTDQGAHLQYNCARSDLVQCIKSFIF